MNGTAAIRNAALLATAVLGRFGATKEDSPEGFTHSIEIEGAGPGKQASRHKVARATPRKTRIAPKFVGHQSLNSEQIYMVMTELKSRHGCCTDWIRENRRRRAAGLPQKRVLPFGNGIFDPLTKEIL